MALKPYRRAVAVTGTYTDSSGAEKKRYTPVGTLMQYEDGNFVLKLDAVPIGGEGWINFYEMDDKREGGGQAKAKGGYGSQRARGDMDDDAIPF